MDVCENKNLQHIEALPLPAAIYHQYFLDLTVTTRQTMIASLFPGKVHFNQCSNRILMQFNFKN